MHHEKEEIICPNCGTHAFGNYCYECGQQTHLHKDTLRGIILHFFEHYFHYDNKFWQTIKTLLFKPGELSLAYWKQQRMRYISPISLYIFISAIYFGSIILFLPLQEKRALQREKELASYMPVNVKSTQTKGAAITYRKINVPDPVMFSTILEKIYHIFPKLFFFLIPMSALFLKLLFLKRHEIYFVDHLIFSIHFHSFFFFLQFIFSLINLLPTTVFAVATSLAMLIIPFMYFRQALQVAYQVSGKRATLYTFLFGFGYMMIMIPTMVAIAYYIVSNLH